MRAIPRRFKHTALFGMVAAGVTAIGMSAASASYLTQSCDRSGRDCVTLRCDDGGDDCRPIIRGDYYQQDDDDSGPYAYVPTYNGGYGVWDADRDGDRQDRDPYYRDDDGDDRDDDD